MIAENILKKLQYKSDYKALIVNAPQEYLDFLSNIQFDLIFNNEQKGNYTFVQIFAQSQSELERIAKSVENAGTFDCVFWACYPKGGGKIKSDIKRETVWKAFDLIGLQAVTQVAIDETWSALRGRPTAMVGK